MRCFPLFSFKVSIYITYKYKYINVHCTYSVRNLKWNFTFKLKYRYSCVPQNYFDYARIMFLYLFIKVTIHYTMLGTLNILYNLDGIMVELGN